MESIAAVTARIAEISAGVPPSASAFAQVLSGHLATPAGPTSDTDACEALATASPLAGSVAGRASQALGDLLQRAGGLFPSSSFSPAGVGSGASWSPTTGTGAIGAGAIGYGAIRTGAIGTSAIGTGASGTSAIGTGAIGTGAMVAPVQGRRGSGFGSRIHPITGARAQHSGIDVAAPAGTPIHAAAGGVVSFAGSRGGYGNLVIVDHPGGLQTYYAHQRDLDVSAGQPVAQGALLGTVGSTGRSTGPHLHFEVRRDGVAVDPAPYLRA